MGRIKLHHSKCVSIHSLKNDPQEETRMFIMLQGQDHSWIDKTKQSFDLLYPGKEMRPLVFIDIGDSVFTDNYNSVFEWAKEKDQKGEMIPSLNKIYSFEP